MKYLKQFANQSDYQTFKESEEYITPNVSYIVEEMGVYYEQGDFIIMTSESNPKVMEICYNQGWAASPYEMYASEAAAVTSIGNVFRWAGGSSSGYGGYGSSGSGFDFSFDEFKYFTGVNELGYCAFEMSGLTSITLPASINKLESFVFGTCSKLTQVTCLSTTAPELRDTDQFGWVSTNGVFKYPSGSDYSTVIAVLPSTWTTEEI